MGAGKNVEVFSVGFFGHRRVEDPSYTEAVLEKEIRALLHRHEYVEFFLGRSGAFDLLAASCIRRCRRRLGEAGSALVLVLPYMTAECRNGSALLEQYYDEIMICEEAEGAHYKAAHQIRNRWIVDRADLNLFYVQRERGGA